MSTWRSDDLASVLIQPDLNFAGYTTGVIKAWDSDTFENTITFKGADHQDLPVMSGVEALTYAPGDVLMLMRWSPSGGGTSTYWIAGRALTPGAGRAEDTITFLRTSLGRSISAEILADRVHADTSTSQSHHTSSTGGYTTHSQGNPALLENVEVSAAGVLIVYMSASIDTTSSGDGAVTGRMGVDIDGPTAIAPQNSRAVRISQATATGMGGTYAHVYSVDEGTYTIESRYAVSILATTGTVSFGESTLIAIAL